jgi:putative ABC transport system permease protein
MFQFDLSNPASLVVDEAFVRQIGLSDPQSAIDKLVYLPVAAEFQPVRIIGVVANQPLVFAGDGTVSNVYDLTERPEQILIRIAKDDVSGALQTVRGAWQRRAPDQVFEYEFEDQLFAQGYAVFSEVSAAFARLATLAYVICAIGLVGMAGHMTGRRRREIGVRKTFGATWQSVLRLLLFELSKPIVVANLVAWPFAYLAAQAYLAIFIHRVPLTMLPFAASLVVSMLLAWAAVAVQAWRAARAEPADVLRNE